MARKSSINPLSLLFVVGILAYGVYTVNQHATSRKLATNEAAQDGPSQDNPSSTGPTRNDDGAGSGDSFTIPEVNLPDERGSDALKRRSTRRVSQSPATPPAATRPVAADRDGIDAARRNDTVRSAPSETSRTATSQDIVAGRVVSVVDGDTIDLLVDNETLRIRLEGIDAPERGQAYGSASREYLKQLCNQRVVYAILSEQDRYGRWIGDLYLEQVWINGEMVKAGFAWHYIQYSESRDLAELQRQAKAASVGLWSEPVPTAPWQFRSQQRAADPIAERESNAGRTVQ